MANPELTNGILRTDARGWVHTPAERREALLNEFEKSGMSGKKFAPFIGIKHQTFSNWVTKRRRARQGRSSGTVAAATVQTSSICKPQQPAAAALPRLQWMEAVVEQDNTSSKSAEVLNVHLPGGARLEISDVRQVALAAELLRALASGSPKPLPC